MGEEYRSLKSGPPANPVSQYLLNPSVALRKKFSRVPLGWATIQLLEEEAAGLQQSFSAIKLMHYLPRLKPFFLLWGSDNARFGTPRNPLITAAWWGWAFQKENCLVDGLLLAINRGWISYVSPDARTTHAATTWVHAAVLWRDRCDKFLSTPRWDGRAARCSLMQSISLQVRPRRTSSSIERPAAG